MTELERLKALLAASQEQEGYKDRTTAIQAAIDALGDPGDPATGTVFDPTLIALANLDASTGLLEQTGTDLFAKRPLGTAAATGVLTRADGDGRYVLQSTLGANSGTATLTASGKLPATQFPILTGDLTTAGGSLATTLATVNGNVGSFGSTSAVPVLTVNAKGLVTAVSTAALGTSAVKNTGTSGNTVPLLDGANTFSALQTFSASVAVTGTLSATGAITENGAQTYNTNNLLSLLRARQMNASYYYPPVGLAMGTTSSLAVTTNRMYFVPFGTMIEANGIAVEVVTAAASSQVRLGIYDCDSKGQPSNLILDAGTVATDTTGTKVIAITTTTFRKPIWLVAHFSGTPTMRTQTLASSGPALGGYVTVSSGSSDAFLLAYKDTTFAALPSTASGLTAASPNVLGGTIMHIALRGT